MAERSVVIPTRDAARTLGRVLESLAAQEPGPLEVIVVDDGSFAGAHEHQRRTFGDLRRQQRRLACSLARAIPLERRAARRTLRRVPLHYFALLRLPVVYRRIADYPGLRSRFLSLLPRLAVAEWTLSASAVRYAARPPTLRGGSQPRFE